MGRLRPAKLNRHLRPTNGDRAILRILHAATPGRRGCYLGCMTPQSSGREELGRTRDPKQMPHVIKRASAQRVGSTLELDSPPVLKCFYGS